MLKSYSILPLQILSTGPTCSRKCANAESDLRERHPGSRSLAAQALTMTSGLAPHHLLHLTHLTLLL